MTASLPDQPSLAETTHTSLTLPEGFDQNTWEVVGYSLIDRTHSLSWWLGDWWNAGHAFGHRKAFVESDAWTGPGYGTCRDIGWVCNRFPADQRWEDLPFSFHREVAGVADDELRAWLLGKASDEGWTQKVLRAQVKAQKALEDHAASGVSKSVISAGVSSVKSHYDAEAMAQVWTLTATDHWLAENQIAASKLTSLISLATQIIADGDKVPFDPSGPVKDFMIKMFEKKGGTQIDG